MNHRCAMICQKFANEGTGGNCGKFSYFKILKNLFAHMSLLTVAAVSDRLEAFK
jgi:hypothetical protein